MGVVLHGHCCRPWPSGATSAAISWPATLWATAAALNFVDFERGGELLIHFHIGENPLIFATMAALTNMASAAACGPLAPVLPQSVGATHHGRRRVLSVLFKMSKGRSSIIFFHRGKNKVNQNTQLSDGLFTLPMAIWRPFRHNHLAQHIMVDAGCTRFCSKQARGGVLRYFFTAAKIRQIQEKILNNQMGSWRCRGLFGSDLPSTFIANAMPIKNNQPASGGERVWNKFQEMGGIGAYAGHLVGLFVEQRVGVRSGRRKGRRTLQ
jgi:hypothetical protein